MRPYTLLNLGGRGEAERCLRLAGRGADSGLGGVLMGWGLMLVIGPRRISDNTRAMGHGAQETFRRYRLAQIAHGRRLPASGKEGSRAPTRRRDESVAVGRIASRVRTSAECMLRCGKCGRRLGRLWGRYGRIVDTVAIQSQGSQKAAGAA